MRYPLAGPPWLMAAETEIPSKFKARLKFGWDQLIWILPLVAAERAVESHMDQASYALAAWLVYLFAGSEERRTVVTHIGEHRRRALGLGLLIVGVLCTVSGVYILMTERTNQVAHRPAQPLEPTIAVPAAHPTAGPQVAPSPPTPAPPTVWTVDPEKAPIFWRFEHGRPSFEEKWLLSWEGDKDHFWISRYAIAGYSNSDQQLTNIRAYVVPKNTGEKVFLQFEGGLATADAAGIPPKAQFTLVADFPFKRLIVENRPEGLTVEDFLQKLGGFKFVFECDELKPYERDFSYTDLRDKLTAIERQDREGRNPPTIRRKGD